MEIPGIFRCPKEVIRGFDELRSPHPPSQTSFNPTSGDVPSLGQSRKSRPKCCCQQMCLNCLLHMASQCQESGEVGAQAIHPESPDSPGDEIGLYVMWVLVICTTVYMSFNGSMSQVPGDQERVGRMLLLRQRLDR